MSTSRWPLWTIFLVAVFAAPAHAATPEEREQARQHYESATRKYDTGRYEDAAAEFQQVFDLMGDPALLFNIAQSYRGAKKYDKALLFYRSFLRRTPADAPGRDEAEKRIGELNEIIKNQPQPKPEPQTTTPPQPGTTTTAQAPPPKPIDRRPYRIAGLTLCAVGLAGLVVGGAMSGIAVSESNSLTRAASMHPTEFTPSLNSSQSLGSTAQTVSIAGYAVGGAAAVAGIALTVIGYRHEQPPVSVGVAGSSLVVTGRF